MLNRRFTAAGILLAAAVSTAACSSTPGAHGTETIHGKNTGAAAEANNPVFHLTLTGPVGTTGTTTLGGGNPAKGQRHTIATSDGKLVVTLNNAGKNTSSKPATPKCHATTTTTVPFTVDGAQSTGKFAHAKGTGHAVVVFAGDEPVLKIGKCDEASNALPVTGTAVSTFTATIALALK